jgi:DDE_Tnp_1-associated
MEYSTAEIERELNALGMEYAKGSVYDRFCPLTDLRSVDGKRYELEGVLTILVLAKLCGEDKPMGIAEWAKYRQGEFVKLLGLSWTSMPHQNTYRRILAYKV